MIVNMVICARRSDFMQAFDAKFLPLQEADLDVTTFMDELIDANTQLEVYKCKLNASKLNQAWFLPTLQKKEALASSLLEGTQATLDGVLVDQTNPSEKDKDMFEVRNYINAAHQGYVYLRNNSFTIDFIKELHKTLMEGNVRRNKKTIPGEFRTEQNYLGREKMISYIPPVAENVDGLMKNLIEYINDPQDKLRPLVRTAIIHAQFETIHPFMDGNGRVGRIIIPLCLYKYNQISLPCFFVSEALERDKFKYYNLLNGIRTKNDWGSWIAFFLKTVAQQCKKYIDIIDQINELYENDLELAKKIIKSNKVVDLINLLYTYPIITANIVTQKTDIPPATATRYLNALAEAEILYMDSNKLRNKTFYYYDLLNVLR